MSAVAYGVFLKIFDCETELWISSLQVMSLTSKRSGYYTNICNVKTKVEPFAKRKTLSALPT